MFLFQVRIEKVGSTSNLIPYEHFTEQMRNYLDAVTKAGGKLENLVKSISITESRVQFGPNLETAYWYRLYGGSYDAYGARTPASLLLKMEECVKLGIPIAERDVNLLSNLRKTVKNQSELNELDWFELKELKLYDNRVANSPRSIASEEEVNVLFTINRMTRINVTKKNGILSVLKHFPGGDAQLENTESKPTNYPQSLEELTRSIDDNTLDILDCRKRTKRKTSRNCEITRNWITRTCLIITINNKGTSQERFRL